MKPRAFSMFRRALRRLLTASSAGLLLGGVGALAATDPGAWPTLHGNNQRHGFYPAFPRPPFKLVWRKELHTELTGPRSEVIGGNGLVYMGTYAGRLYAWSAETGAEQWVIQADGPIGHSPALSDGALYFGAMDRGFYAVDAQSGRRLWRFEAAEGFWNSPVVAQGKALMGARDGWFYALDARTGELEWKIQTGDRILTPASVSPNGERVVFASEDMRVYCANLEDGRLLWKTPQLHGLSLRDYAPLIARGLVFVSVNPVKDFHTILNEHQRMILSWANYDGEDDRYIPRGARAVEKEQERIVQFLRDNPEEQTFYAFRLTDGVEPWLAPALYSGGMHNPTPPPCHRPDTGEIFVFVRSAYGVWDGGGEVRPYTGVGRLNVETGRIELIDHGHPSADPSRPAGRKDMPWMSFNTIGDETQTLSCSKDFLFSNHQGYLGSMNFRTGLCANLYGKRDTYGGFFGPGTFGWEKDGGIERAQAAGEPFGIVNEWHGPARAIVSVIDGRLYYPTGSQVLCLEGAP